MGYDLHIHRRADWFDEGDSISLDEWKILIASDNSLQIDGSVFLAPKDGGESVETPTAQWKGDDGSEGHFYWYAGAVCTKNPNQSKISKARHIAQVLKARVQGDDGEFYWRHAVDISTQLLLS